MNFRNCLITLAFLIPILSSADMFMQTPSSAKSLDEAGIESVSKDSISILWLKNSFSISQDRIAVKILESIQANKNTCVCPYMTNASGERCGATSNYTKSGGKSALCYPKDVLDMRTMAMFAGQKD